MRSSQHPQYKPKVSKWDKITDKLLTWFIIWVIVSFFLLVANYLIESLIQLWKK